MILQKKKNTYFAKVVRIIIYHSKKVGDQNIGTI